MKTLIIYSSQTGNTQKLAQAVFDEIKGEKNMVTVDEAPSPEGYDLVAMGFWFQAGKPDPKSAEYLARCRPPARLFLFASHGAAKGSDHAKAGMANAIGLTQGCEIAGTFTCQGQVNPKVLEKAKSKPQPPVWIKDADFAKGHPDDADVKALREAVRGL